MSKTFYQIVVVLLLIVFVAFIAVEQHLYNELLGVNKEYSEMIEEQKENYQQVVLDMEEDYIQYRSNLENGNVSYIFTPEEFELLVKCVEAEAGKGNYESQKYVTQAIMNRVLHSSDFPDTIEEVIYQKTKGDIPQFSVAYDGSINRVADTETYLTVYSAILYGTDLPEYVCYFYSEGVERNWVNTLTIYDTVQGVVFAYDEKSKEDY